MLRKFWGVVSVEQDSVGVHDELVLALKLVGIGRRK